MNKNVSEEELLLRKRARRRLVGAIVLVVFSVIVLPIIFDEPKQDSEQHEITVNLPVTSKNNQADIANLQPKQESGEQEALNRTDPFADFKIDSKIKPQDTEETIEALGERKRTPIPGIKPRIESKPITETKNTVTATTTTNPINDSIISDSKLAVPEVPKEFVVQLGAYSDQSKAKQQVENLIFNGFKAYTETLKTGNAEVTRVRIGSFPTRNAAENEVKKLKKAGFDGVVTIK